jgi:galactonate dehydratase
VTVNTFEVWNVREPSSRRMYGVVRLQTNDGAAGWGEGPPLAPAHVESARQAVKGQPVHSYKVVHSRLAGHPAAGAIDMALLDVLGQRAKAPVYQVLGGPTRTKARGMTEWSPEARARGYKAFVVDLPRIVFPNPRAQFVARVRQTLDDLRRQAGEDSDFVLDGANELTAAEAANVAAALEKFHLLFFDEPCALTNLPAARKISEENVTPVGWGRHIARLAEVQDLLREQMVDVVRLDLWRHGLTGIRVAAAVAETYYVAVAPYHRGGPIATAAALHLAAALPHFYIQQIPWSAGDDARMRAEIVGADIEKPVDGFLPLLNSPGLGIQVSEAALRRYAA